MKWILLFMLAIPRLAAGQDLLLLDRQGKRPAEPATAFTDSDVFRGLFPIYKSDRGRLSSLLVAAAKRIQASRSDDFCADTLYAGHTRLLFHQREVRGVPHYSVHLVTVSPDLQVSAPFIRDIADRRHLQRSLIELATYLEEF